MIFTDSSLSTEQFLNEYWQQKPVVIRNAFPQFKSLINGDELAGLALDEAIESRIVIEDNHHWTLEKGPFTETTFSKLPKTHWTLLVQGVDRLIPEIAALVDSFNFIPRWRFDDVMISYAVKHGSVGPHYDNYDVFLLQAEGQREWSLTSKACNEHNCIEDSALRIMADFETEETHILNPGDILYVPPHIGHHGVALSDDCMTYSFGYRSYQARELIDSFAQYINEAHITTLYRDPNFSQFDGIGELHESALDEAQHQLKQLIDNKEWIRTWFGRHVTQLDDEAEKLLPIPLDEFDTLPIERFQQYLTNGSCLMRDPICRIAYNTNEHDVELYINGTLWDDQDASESLIRYLANHTVLHADELQKVMSQPSDIKLLHDLYRLQWLLLETK